MLKLNLPLNNSGKPDVIKMFFIVIDKNSIGICENISCKGKSVCSFKNKRGCISPAASLNFLSFTQMFFIPDNHNTTSRYHQIRDACGCALPAENPLSAARSGKP